MIIKYLSVEKLYCKNKFGSSYDNNVYIIKLINQHINIQDYSTNKY